MHPKARIRIVFAIGLLLLFGCSDQDPAPLGVDGSVPDAIEDVSISYVDSTDDVYLTWTAPANGGRGGSVDRYEIRYVYDAPFDWETAFPVLDPPQPVPPGEIQSYRHRYPGRGRDLYMAVSSVGASGDPSAPSNTAYLKIPGFTFTGVCRDVYTRDALAGVKVELLGADGTLLLETNADGEFSVSNTVPQELTVTLARGEGDPTHFPMSQLFVLAEDVSHTFLLIPYQKSDVLPSLSLLQLFKMATNTSSTPILRKWARRPVQTYIPSFVNPHGIDYGEAARAAVQRWMDRTGIELFGFVEAPPDTGVEFRFMSPSDMGGAIGLTRHTDGSDELPLKDIIEVVNDLSEGSVLNLVLLHEIGHTIRFGHLPSVGFLMYGGLPLPDDISDDEVQLVKLLEALPNRIDMRIYRESEP